MASALCKGSSGVDVSKGGCCVMELYTSLIKTTKLLVLFLTINASVILKYKGNRKCLYERHKIH